MTTVDQLVNMMNNNVIVGPHLKYIPFDSNENEITEFICGCLLNYHYSAVLPLNIFKKEFKPRNNVFYFECN